MTDSIDIDDLTISDETDFGELIFDVLLGRVGQMLPNDLGRGDWLLRVYASLQGTPYEEPLIEAIAAGLISDAVEVRSGALLFFSKFPHTKGAERLIDAVEDHRELFAGFSSAGESRIDLLWLLLKCIGTRIVLGDARAIEIGRREAVRSGVPEPLVAALAHRDPEWVAQNAESIVRATPATALPLLFNLRMAGVSVADLGQRIAPFAARDDRFLAMLDTVIDDPSIARAIRQAAENGPS